jgi:hypothetical protein
MQGKALLLINGKAKQTYVFSLKQIGLFLDPEKEINQSRMQNVTKFLMFYMQKPNGRTKCTILDKPFFYIFGGL